MRLNTQIIEKLKGNNGLRRQLKDALGVSRTSIWNYIDKNEENGELTKAVATKLIAEHYNVPMDELLETTEKAA